MALALERAAVARLIDHTLLAPEATSHDVGRLCAEAAELGVGAVCVSPSLLPLPAGALAAGLAVVTVVGFPSGAHAAAVKAAEAAQARSDGATELDMVVDLGLVKAAQWGAVRAEVEAVRHAAPRPALLKVIIEAAVLTDAEIVATCRAAEDAGADYVKTSTGFHPKGGASAHAVALMRATVADRLGVKASGGIRTAADALVMLEAGASRLGTSASRAILEGWATA